MAEKQFPMSRIPLVIYYKQLGDVLLLEPALAKLAASSNTRVALATRPEFSPMISLMNNVEPAVGSPAGFASRVISFDPRFKAWIRTLLTRSSEKQLIVTRPKHLQWWHRIAYRAGCAVRNEDAFYRARYFFDLIPGDSSFPFRPPCLAEPPADWLPANLPESYVLVHPTSAWKSKCWPAESWAITLGALHSKGIGPFVVTGGKAEREIEFADTLEQKAGVPVVNLCGKTTLQSYLAVVSRAKMVLCVDGSASHLAAAFRRPSVTLFGPTHPLHWHYPCPGSHLVDARSYIQERKPGLEHIPVEAVVNEAVSAWEEIRS